MRGLWSVRSSIAFFLLTGLLAAQSVPRNRISLSGGWGSQISVFPTNGESAPALGISYGFRPLRWFELESGLVTALHPGGPICSAHGCFDPDDRYFWVPFGVRFVAPIAWQRVELSAGGGGLYQKYTANSANPYNVQSYGAWGGYFTGGAAVSLDRSRRFWLGATPRVMLANPAFRRDRWFVITGDVGFRF